MNLSLYDITAAFPVLMEQEEMTEEEKAKVEEELTILLQQKSQNIIGYTKDIEAMIEAIKTEENRLATNRKALENRVKKFKEYVKDCMEKNGFSKIETELGTLSIARNPISIEIINQDLIPKEFIQEVITIKPDKTALRNHFKETGELPEGVKINSQNTSLRIK